MSSENNKIIELSNPSYVPVMKESTTYYGGSQMWFPTKHWFSKDYVLHNYGCGTIAAADMLLYLAMQNEALRSPETAIALQGTGPIQYNNYDTYVRVINNKYTKTRRIIAVLGPALATAINDYARTNDFSYEASWKWSLTYFDMLDIIEEMLHEDIPVILSIGPNTPLIWGKIGIPFYHKIDIELPKADETKKVTKDQTKEIPATHYYKVVQQNINSHYVNVTGVIRDDVTGTIMLRISSWGTQYYVNYEEYRDYIENTGGTFTSSVVYVKQIK